MRMTFRAAPELGYDEFSVHPNMIKQFCVLQTGVILLG